MQPYLVLPHDGQAACFEERTATVFQESFVSLFTGRTTVVIAHRLATVQHADEILVLAPCRDDASSSVIERGTHKQLLSQNGSYAKMWRAQTEA